MAKRYLNHSADTLASVQRSKIKNMRVMGAGAGEAGDRTANVAVPFYSSSPETFTNPIQRWREYCLMWQTSWEVRKIVGIPVDDALRKPPELKGISTKSQDVLKKKCDKLQAVPVLKRSLKLERLLGGCLTFMGLEAEEDDAESTYRPEEGKRLLFLNAIPISRISRMTWDTNPLHEAYMRPKSFFVNNVDVSVSRCLVWDGQPLFDQNDFALTNYRANLAGFGPSVIGALFDDVVMACGTRQAAYQMVQIAGAIVATMDQLQDIAGTAPGQDKLSKIERMLQDLSVFRATILSGDKIQVQSFSPAFGSVPELLMAYLQVLSAASDIPACRFLGQAPGGLSTDDRSGLENYYNQIDAFQQERISPQLLRLYDVIGYSEIGPSWKQEREDLEIVWPPLWNETSKEKAERQTITVDNVIKVIDSALSGEDWAVEELNASGTFSTKLEKEDMELLRDAQNAVTRHMDGVDPQTGKPIEPGSKEELHKKPSEREDEKNKESDPGAASEQIQRLRNMNPFVRMVNSDPRSLVAQAGYDPDEFVMQEVKKGYSVEQEHPDVTGGDPVAVMKIVMAHLTEVPDYYSRLEKVEEE